MRPADEIELIKLLTKFEFENVYAYISPYNEVGLLSSTKFVKFMKIGEFVVGVGLTQVENVITLRQISTMQKHLNA